MGELQVGDRVQVATSTGELAFDDVVLVGLDPASTGSDQHGKANCCSNCVGSWLARSVVQKPSLVVSTGWAPEMRLTLRPPLRAVGLGVGSVVDCPRLPLASARSAHRLKVKEKRPDQ